MSHSKPRKISWV